jgi:hypothetical protein
MLITVPLGLGLAELVVEQAPPDGDPLQVAGPREVLDLVLEQHRPTLGVDQGAVEIRLLAEDGRGAVHVGVGLEDQHLDDHDQADQHPAQGELERAPPPARSTGMCLPSALVASSIWELRMSATLKSTFVTADGEHGVALGAAILSPRPASPRQPDAPSHSPPSPSLWRSLSELVSADRGRG